MTDFTSLTSKALKTIRKYEDDFMKLGNSEDKLTFVYEKLTENNIEIESAVKKWKKFPAIQTDFTKAKEYREKGNQFYKNKQLEKADQCYRKALNQLPGHSWENKDDREEFVLALGNLSAVSFETNNFLESRVFAQVVLACGEKNLTEERSKKFMKRSKQCLKNMKSLKIMEQEDINLPKYKKESYTINFEDQHGRNAVAVEEIKFGEVILIEDPVGSRCKINKSIRQCENCNKCLHQKQEEEIISSPLDKEVKFCSLKCLIAALESFHFYESKLNFSKVFPKDDLASNLSLLPLRLITQKPPQYFESAMNSSENGQLDQPDYGCGEKLDDILGYSYLNSMVTHMDNQSILSQMEMAVTSIILHQCLIAMEYLKQGEQLQGLSLHVTSLLYQYQAAVRCNAYQIEWNYKDKLIQGEAYPGTHLLTVGTGVYPILCLLNHSCDANTIRFNINNKVLLVASRNIKKGEEVTSSYGETFLTSNKKTRQEINESKYHFVCECDACVCDYPTFTQLANQLPDQIFDTVNRGFENIEKKLNNQQYLGAIGETIHLYSVTSSVPELHMARQRLRVLLGTCYKMAFSLSIL